MVEKNTVFIPGPVGKLEAIISDPQDQQSSVVGVICHPHPLFEGTMHNKVVTTVAKAFEHQAMATVRFNYRGVGHSEGSYGEMIGEIEDLKSVLSWVKQRWPSAQIILAGFSFGAFIAASVANQITPKKLISIAPAVNHANFSGLSNIDCPWLVIQGDQDEIVPVDQVLAFVEHPPAALTFELLPDAGHFFHGKLLELREIVIRFLQA